MRDGFSEREIVYKAEDLILRLRDIRSCRIVTGETGAITEIHVVASSNRPPKMIARDVETALKAELDLDVDYRKIGVVMIDPVGRGGANDGESPPGGRSVFDTGSETILTDELIDDRFTEVVPEVGPPEAGEIAPDPVIEQPSFDNRPEPVTISISGPVSGTSAEEETPDDGEKDLEFLEDSTRIGFCGLSLSMEKESIKAEVRLSSNGLEVIGCVDECCGNRPVFETVAGAAVKALVELLDENFNLCLSEVRELDIKGRKALVAVVDMIRGRDSNSFSGCAFVGRDSGEAAVMAVLDAVNRPFGRWKSRREIHYRIR